MALLEIALLVRDRTFVVVEALLLEVGQRLALSHLLAAALRRRHRLLTCALPVPFALHRDRRQALLVNRLGRAALLLLLGATVTHASVLLVARLR